ncbi:MAG: universal stress protein [Deltaproteobacteria bacterium]|jgi:universal stress protein A|nr:universal stress protein [Deltaproteobacteria bacterium]MBT6433630.1 universal stress protein [Deltaproteobacteria bacterium]MBT6488732.1 universal stress protein [Deltaproteobacteria bacterium]
MNTYRRLVVATDFSALGNRAVRVAYVQAWPNESQLVICHALNEESTQWLLSHPNPTKRNEVELAHAFMRSLVAPDEQKPGINIVTKVLRGKPADSIIELAQEVRAELIVAGTHGRDGIERLMLGSVAEALVRGAPCSVLVVRDSNESMEPV